MPQSLFMRPLLIGLAGLIGGAYASYRFHRRQELLRGASVAGNGDELPQGRSFESGLRSGMKTGLSEVHPARPSTQGDPDFGAPGLTHH